MTAQRLFEQFKEWIKTKFTGIVTIHFHEGGIRKVRIEHDLR
jgi:hypothetical protein